MGVGSASPSNTIWQRLVITAFFFSAWLFFAATPASASTSTAAAASSTPPQATASFPAPGSTGVSVTATPWVEFSEALDPATVVSDNIQLRRFSDNGLVTSTLVLDSGGTQVSFALVEPLEYLIRYYFFIGRGIKDSQGLKLEDTWYASDKTKHAFTTVAAPALGQSPETASSSSTKSSENSKFSETSNSAGSATEASVSNNASSNPNTNSGASPANAGASATGGGASGSLNSALAWPPTNPSLTVRQLNARRGTATLLLAAANQPAEMKLATNSSLAGAVWTKFSSNLIWNLTGERAGTTTVYAKFKNSGGESELAWADLVVRRDAALYGEAGSGSASPVELARRGGPEVLGEKIIGQGSGIPNQPAPNQARLERLIGQLKFKQRSAAVRDLQIELKRLGHLPKNWKLTNYYGVATRAAVQKYRASRRRLASASVVETKQVIAR